MEVKGERNPTKKGELMKIDDDDPRSKDKPDGNKKAKDKLKNQAMASILREKIDRMVQSNEMMLAKILEAKMLLAEKKNQEKNQNVAINLGGGVAEVRH